MLETGPSHITREHLTGHCPYPVHLPLVLGDSLTAKSHAEPRVTSLSPPVARFHTPPIVGRTMALKYMPALIPGTCEIVTLQEGFHRCDQIKTLEMGR